jgi:hypothetical protein
MHMSPGLLVPRGQPEQAGLRHKLSAPTTERSAWLRWLVVVALAVAAWAGTAALRPAHAGEWGWSVGVQAPGAVVQVANMPPPVVVLRPPVYAAAPQVVWVDQWGNPIRQAYPQPQPQPNRYWGEERSRHHRHHHDRGHGYGRGGWEGDRW